MDQALNGAGLGATVTVVLQNLLSRPIEQIKLVWDSDKGITKLVDSLYMIQDFVLDAEMKQANSWPANHWLEKLQDVLFEADAVLDEFHYELLRQNVQKQVTASFACGSCNLLFCSEMAVKVKDLNVHLLKINEQANSYGLKRVVMGANHVNKVGSVPQHQVQTDSLSVEPNMIGRDDDVSKIVDMLATAPLKEPFSVIPILGMGGIGKTTLAQKVFHHKRIGARFDIKIWICVSVNFDVMTLLKMILEIVSKENVPHFFTKEVVLNKIRRSLANKRYLLVLDDVWNEKYNEWDAFMSSLLGTCSVNGNCIIVTTRTEKVASNVGTVPTYRLSSLSQDECWSIIKAKTFSQKAVPSGFKVMGKDIAQRCGGLPLAAKVIGGLLRGKSKSEWQSICRNQLLTCGLNDNTIMNILKLSYDQLPSSSFRKCFAYCSIFPQDFRINKEQLIMLWMAEGFLQAKRKNDTEAIGEIIFNHLLQNSLFQDVEKDKYDNITHCKMHDLACSLSGFETISSNEEQSNGVHQSLYLALKPFTYKSYAILKEEAKCLRTIFVEGKGAENMVVGFTRLHVLKLTCSDIQELPYTIGELIHLRFLDISGTSIKYLPDSVGLLYNLQTLWTFNGFGRQDTSLKKFPNTIIDLISLRHLHISSFAQLPPHIGKLISLQTLPYYKVGYENGCRIEELQNLKNLKGNFEIQNLVRVKDKQEAMYADLSRKPNICKLVFKWNESIEGEINDENVLDGLQPYPSLKSLEIYGYRGQNFPFWTMNMVSQCNINGSPWEGLDNLVNVKLSGCTKCEEIPMLGHLPHLKFLELKSSSNVKSTCLSFHGVTNSSTSCLFGHEDYQEINVAFPALEMLNLLDMPNLTEWVDAETAITAFPCLEHLRIEFCPKLNTVPSHFPRLKELRIKEVDVGFSLEDICSNTIYLKSVRIESLLGLICLPDELFTRNQNLTDLWIERCPMLTRLVTRSLGGGASLKRLNISLCTSLNALPDDLDTLHALEELIIQGCYELRSIPYARGQSQGLTSLRVMRVWNCPGLTDFPSELLESCTVSLRKLEFAFLENLENLGPGSCHFRNLWKLSLGGFSGSMNYASFNDFLHYILQGNHSLEFLFIYGKEHWDSIPDQIQHLSTLQEFGLADFGIKDMPEWLGNLSLLHSLIHYTFQTARS